MRASAYVKMLAAGAVCCVGGPALVRYVSPDPNELFKRYNPDLQKKTLESRDELGKRNAEFGAKLREYSKSDRPIWVVAAEDEKKQREAAKAERKRVRDELERQRREILEESLGRT